MDRPVPEAFYRWLIRFFQWPDTLMTIFPLPALSVEEDGRVDTIVDLLRQYDSHHRW